ncbi:MAG: lytic transglycosylase domain-containing protein [Deltaproteobacteria bacterium]|nr:lytic transglycosylase domain-containing protein [Deltaproteobacteria bacterium]
MSLRALIIAGIFFFSIVIPGVCGIYLYIDPDGVYHFSDTPKTPAYKPITSVPETLKARPGRERRYDRLIRRISAKSGVRSELVKAVIKVESNFNPRAVSKAGAIGLMQLMPVHFDTNGMSDPYDPGQNITAGTMYLKKLLGRYDGDIVLCLAAYNAGPKAVDRYGSIPPYGETRAFVDRVLSHYYRYRYGNR